MTTEVVNFRKVERYWNVRAETWLVPNMVYIGRENRAYHLKASLFANPFPVSREKGETEASARRRSIALYRDYLQRRPDLLAQARTLRGKKLVCLDRECHGDVLLELVDGKKTEFIPSQQVTMDGRQQPVLAWDKGGAAFQIAQNKYGVLYRTDVKIAYPVGLPGKTYVEWADWQRDAVKLAFRVKGCAVCSGMSQKEYARFRYETALKAREGNMDSYVQVERDVLRELLAELDDGDGP